MRVTQQVLESQNEGRIEARRANVLRLLKRCEAPVPSDLAAVIETMQDMNLLLVWFDAAAEASTYDEFRAAVLPRQ